MADTDPSSCVLDAYRTAVAIRLSETLPVTLRKAYDGVDYGKRGEDFTVVLPIFQTTRPFKNSDFAEARSHRVHIGSIMPGPWLKESSWAADAVMM